MTDDAALLSAEELEARLRKVGAERYHNLHRFHRRLHSGGCSYEEVQAWALNRYYYQIDDSDQGCDGADPPRRSRGPPAMAQAHRGS